MKAVARPKGFPPGVKKLAPTLAGNGEPGARSSSFGDGGGEDWTVFWGEDRVEDIGARALPPAPPTDRRPPSRGTRARRVAAALSRDAGSGDPGGLVEP